MVADLNGPKSEKLRNSFLQRATPTHCMQYWRLTDVDTATKWKFLFRNRNLETERKKIEDL